MGANVRSNLSQTRWRAWRGGPGYDRKKRKFEFMRLYWGFNYAGRPSQGEVT
jgi:hypothetical protein